MKLIDLLTTDPDASPMHQKKGSTSRLGYLTHYVVDGGRARVVLNVLVTGAEVTENLPMQEMLFRSTFRWRLRPRSATGDAAYGTRENIAAIEKALIDFSAGRDDQGRFRGQLVSTGLRPKFTQDLEDQGVELPHSLFTFGAR